MLETLLSNRHLQFSFYSFHLDYDTTSICKMQLLTQILLLYHIFRTIFFKCRKYLFLIRTIYYKDQPLIQCNCHHSHN